MSRSRKKYSIVKDVGFMKKLYWKVIRRVSKQYLNSNKEIPQPKEIINDYDYCDWKIKYSKNNEEWFKKSLRK